jgi:hypothetical protein
MDHLTERFAPAVLILLGLATALPGSLSLTEFSWGDPLTLLVMHRQLLVALLGIGLIAAAFLPNLRVSLIAAAALAKTAFVLLALAVPGAQQGPAHFLSLYVEIAVLAALLAAGVFFWRQALREARWDGAVPGRQEA